MSTCPGSGKPSLPLYRLKTFVQCSHPDCKGIFPEQGGHPTPEHEPVFYSKASLPRPV